MLHGFDRCSLMLNVWAKENSDKLVVEYSYEKLRERCENDRQSTARGTRVHLVRYTIDQIRYCITKVKKVCAFILNLIFINI